MKDLFIYLFILFLNLELDFCTPENEFTWSFYSRPRKKGSTQNLMGCCRKNIIISQFHTSEPSLFNQQVHKIWNNISKHFLPIYNIISNDGKSVPDALATDNLKIYTLIFIII